MYIETDRVEIQISHTYHKCFIPIDEGHLMTSLQIYVNIRESDVDLRLIWVVFLQIVFSFWFHFIFLAHLAYSTKVSFWDRAVSVVRRRASCVVRRASTIYLNIFFSKTTDGKVIKLCIDVP